MTRIRIIFLPANQNANWQHKTNQKSCDVTAVLHTLN